jgi:hypothetical protein
VPPVEVTYQPTPVAESTAEEDMVLQTTVVAGLTIDDPQVVQSY